MRFAVDRLNHLVINCRDVEIMASWYQRVLGMDREAFGEGRRTALKFGGQKLNLRPHDAPAEDWIAAAECRPGTQDLCFIVAFNAADVVGHLHGCGVMIEQGPVAKVGALGPIMSVYCRNPDGNLIEISTYSG
jgi:catechol 2,3-dioxygenase-like lactoylglutathione lyase family enzyme